MCFLALYLKLRDLSNFVFCWEMRTHSFKIVCVFEVCEKRMGESINLFGQETVNVRKNCFVSWLQHCSCCSPSLKLHCFSSVFSFFKWKWFSGVCLYNSLTSWTKMVRAVDCEMWKQKVFEEVLLKNYLASQTLPGNVTVAGSESFHYFLSC